MEASVVVVGAPSTASIQHPPGPLFLALQRNIVPIFMFNAARHRLMPIPTRRLMMHNGRSRPRLSLSGLGGLGFSCFATAFSVCAVGSRARVCAVVTCFTLRCRVVLHVGRRARVRAWHTHKLEQMIICGHLVYFLVRTYTSGKREGKARHNQRKRSTGTHNEGVKQTHAPLDVYGGGLANLGGKNKTKHLLSVQSRVSCLVLHTH